MKRNIIIIVGILILAALVFGLSRKANVNKMVRPIKSVTFKKTRWTSFWEKY
ncbi:MAG: hypothetical protein HQL15_11155 [Candidatus Omnitrophica bacterium]|nr:hypothetical protein [Candidatus Omnitrophota bacterium]